MIWTQASRVHVPSREIADRHYNRQSIGHPNFMPPGRCCVFYAANDNGRAVWGTSWPFAEYVKHAWAGAWVCSIFRNEGAGRASEMIVEAVSATRAFFGDPPPLGMITFVDRRKVKPTIVRGEQVWGLDLSQGWVRPGRGDQGRLAGASVASGRHAGGRIRLAHTSE